MMVILNTKELRLTVQMAHITTALSFLLTDLLDFLQIYQCYVLIVRMINDLLCQELG